MLKKINLYLGKIVDDIENGEKMYIPAILAIAGFVIANLVVDGGLMR